MDAIQEHFECCGMDSISDWASVDIPMSCCISTASVCGKANFNATTDRSEYFQEVSLKCDYKSSSIKASLLLN